MFSLSILIIILIIKSSIAAEIKDIHQPYPQDCKIFEVDEFGFTHYYLNSTIELGGFNGVITLLLPPIGHILYQNNQNSEYMHFDFDSTKASLDYKNQKYVGYLSDGTILYEEYDYYTDIQNLPEHFLVYASLDLINEQIDEDVRGRIRYSLAYNLTSEEYYSCGVHLGYLVFDDKKNIKDEISSLEAWSNSIIEIIDELLDHTISSLLLSSQNHETRITILESQNISQPNITISDYWKYLGSSDRKNIVCGIATDNHLDTLTMQELGYNCDVAYKQTSRGEKASCRCSKI